MSKIKNISATGWLVAGIIAALVLVPTTAVAVTATATIIQNGTGAGQVSVTAHRLQTNDEIRGYSGNNYADVTSDGQLLTTTTTDPSAFVNSSFVAINSQQGFLPIVSAPSGNAMIVTTIHINVVTNPDPGPDTYISLFITNTPACDSQQVGSYDERMNPPSIGETDIPFNPGLAIPAGDSLCAATVENGTGLASAEFTVTGYLVPSSEVPASPLHRAPALPQQNG